MRNAVVLVTDEAIFPAAMFAAHRLAALKNRDDTDIIVFTDANRQLPAANAMHLPFQLAPMIYPQGVRLPPEYYRLFLPNFLGKHYRRILYVDVDTYAENSGLYALFDLDMRGRLIGAVRDWLVAFGARQSELDATLGGRHAKYLNSGVLLIDCEAYVAREALLGLLEIVRVGAAQSIYRDQSALNTFLRGDWLELSPAFNMFIAGWNSPLSRICEPVITHFAGQKKPWHGPHFRSDHPARAEMERFFPASPWKGFLPRFFNVRDAIDLGTEGKPDGMDWAFKANSPFVRYLRETEFADVTAGLTTLHLEHLPGGC